MKFTLICQQPQYNSLGGITTSYDGDKLTSEFQAVELDVILENMNMFLRGCGFNPSGTLVYVENDE